MLNSQLMELALNHALKAKSLDEVPVAALIYDNSTQKIISIEHNLVKTNKDPTAHAEILAIRSACQQLNTSNLSDYIMYVTLQPCNMCLEAIYLSRITKVFFGAFSDYQQLSIYKNIELFGGFGQKASAELIKCFFQDKR